MKKNRKESGEIMLEAAIIFPMVIIIILAMLGLGFLYYQKAMLQTVATEAATEIGESYKYYKQGIEDKTITLDAVKGVEKYRTSFGIFKMQKKNKKRVENYLPERVKKTNLGVLQEEPAVENVKVKVDNIGRLHVEVTVRMKSEVLFEGALKTMGIIGETPTFYATARAECMDITAYAGHVRYAKYVSEKIGNIGSVGKIGTVVDNIKNIATTIVGI